ncbi:STE20-related adapter protein [Aphelenchoides avenae]|nr:STE20-related adapter protein [Aphelenchus avenae]
MEELMWGKRGASAETLFIRCAGGVSDSKKIQRELALVRSLKHPNIVSGLDAVEDEKFIYVCSPIMCYGSAARVMANGWPDGLPEGAIRTIAHQTLKALSYLHEQEVIHRSVHADHLLLDADGTVKVCGLHRAVLIRKCNRWIGVSGSVHDFDESLEDSFIWLAPEVFKQDIEGYGVKSDVYSVGVTLCELGNGFPPFQEMEPLQILYKKMRGATPFVMDSKTMPPEEGAEKDALSMRTFSDSLHDLVKKCLSYYAEERPSAEELQNHEFFKDADKTRLAELLKNTSPLQLMKL